MQPRGISGGVEGIADAITNTIHERLFEIASRVRLISLAVTGLAELQQNDDELGPIADLANEIDAQLTALANEIRQPAGGSGDDGDDKVISLPST